jgi:hypothetical protein
MKRAILLGCILAVAAAAQWPSRQRDRDRDRDRYEDRDRDYRDSRYGDYRGGRSGIAVVERALNDLQRNRSAGRVDGHERKHMEQARYDLIRFRENWSRGKFDKDRLDGAIENLADLARADQVHPRDRQMFARHRDNLREFRANRNAPRIRPWP